MDHVLAVLAIAAVLALFLLVSPTRRCNCGGRCPRCMGTGRRFRRGAPQVRKALLALHKAWKEREES
jgi:hypothetical protein